MTVNGLLALAGLGVGVGWALVELRRLIRSYPAAIQRCDRSNWRGQ